MRLSELLISLALFLLASALFTSSFVNLKSSSSATESALLTNAATINTDSLLRNEIRQIEIPYWKNFEKEYEIQKEKLFQFALQKNIEILSVSTVYDKAHNSEGIRIEWKKGNKIFVTQEFISQRIVNEEK